MGLILGILGPPYSEKVTQLAEVMCMCSWQDYCLLLILGTKSQAANILTVHSTTPLLSIKIMRVYVAVLCVNKKVFERTFHLLKMCYLPG